MSFQTEKLVSSLICSFLQFFRLNVVVFILNMAASPPQGQQFGTDVIAERKKFLVNLKVKAEH